MATSLINNHVLTFSNESYNSWQKNWKARKSKVSMVWLWINMTSGEMSVSLLTIDSKAMYREKTFKLCEDGWKSFIKIKQRPLMIIST